jgi:hypothetical protein
MSVPAQDMYEQVEDGEEELNQENISSILDTVVNTINHKFEHECQNGVVRLLNTHPVRHSPDDYVPGCKYSIPGLSGTIFLPHQVQAVWFIVRRWVWDADMPGALVADEMGLEKTFTLVAVAMLWKLVTENVAMGLPLSIVWGNTHKEWVILVRNDCPRMVGEAREW